MGMFSERLWRGVGVDKNASQILATIDFSSGEISGKTLSVSKNFICNILCQTSHLNFNKFGNGSDFKKCFPYE